MPHTSHSPETASAARRGHSVPQCESACHSRLEPELWRASVAHCWGRESKGLDGVSSNLEMLILLSRMSHDVPLHSPVLKPL